MRRERQRLLDIVEALDSLARIIGERTEVDFFGDEVACYAAAQRLTVVGEAVAGLSSELQSRHPEVPWRDIVAFRNFLVHEYFGIHWPIVWQTATEEAPRLRVQIAGILHSEFPE